MFEDGDLAEDGIWANALVTVIQVPHRAFYFKKFFYQVSSYYSVLVPYCESLVMYGHVIWLCLVISGSRRLLSTTSTARSSDILANWHHKHLNGMRVTKFVVSHCCVVIVFL